MGKPGKSSQESSFSGVTQEALYPWKPVVAACVEYSQPGKLSRERPYAGFWGAGHTDSLSALHTPNFQIPRRTGVQHTPYCLYTQFRDREPKSENGGNPPQIHAPKRQSRAWFISSLQIR